MIGRLYRWYRAAPLFPSGTKAQEKVIQVCALWCQKEEISFLSPCSLTADPQKGEQTLSKGL